ncbi:MAG: SAM-dependent methyltransferase [Oscillatoriales cyanobacterium C42_A2020_001]|nr:SAM-dependent methyltransferase [Leptolyngbyaceae cyanobacterium C42_A2020_001]
MQNAVESFTEDEVFFCPEESYFYSYCLERFVLSTCSSQEKVIEFGCGDVTPVIHSLTRNAFLGVIHGYELNASACQVAKSRIEKYCLTSKYVVHNESFFDANKPNADYLIANPPYLPAPDDDICMPALRGGCDGSGITCKLLTLDIPAVLLMISSYSNPVDTINHAIANGYYVADFMVSPLQFGYYSSEPKVRETIHQLKRDRRAFFSDNIYFLAGVLFRKQHRSAVNVSDELIRVMTAL